MNRRDGMVSERETIPPRYVCPPVASIYATSLAAPTRDYRNRLGVNTYTEVKYLRNDNGTYHIGARFLELGGFARSQMKLYKVASPEIKKLAEETGEHANLMIEEHGVGIYLNKFKGSDAVTIDTHIGKRIHLHMTALGKAILAHMDESEVDAIIDQYGLPAETKHTITDEDELKSELAEIRDRGYAIDDEERVIGLRCVAAPVCNKDGDPLGSVSVSVPTNIFNNENIMKKKIPNSVLNTVNVIEVNMTYS